MSPRGMLVHLTMLAALIVGGLSGCRPPTGPSTESPAQRSSSARAYTIQNKGSDTLLQAAQALAEAYRKVEPGVDVAVAGGGSGTGFQSLVEGTADIANASREIKDKEREQAMAKGVEPIEHIIGYDGIAVIVHKTNPVDDLSIARLSDIYTGAITDWRAVGGFGEIVPFSRDTASGTYEYFKEQVVMKGEKNSGLDFADSVILLLSNSAIRDEVARTETAIGYIGLAYVNDTVKAIGVIGEDGVAVKPSVETVKTGVYPISRPLFMYASSNPSPATAAYLDWISGEQGQKIVQDEGFVPSQ